MKEARPAISVLLSVHNGAGYLGDSLQSVLAQAGEDIELVAVDDGSTDASPRILAQAAAADPRVKVLTRPHTGLTASLNAALSTARGEFIARLDADDKALPGRFASQHRFLLENPEVALVGSNAILIDASDRMIGRTRLGTLDHPACVARLESMAAFIPHSSWMVRGEVMRALGGYDEFFRKAQDYEFMLRLSESHRLACLADFMVALRKTRSSVTFDDEFLQYRYALVALICHRRRIGSLAASHQDKPALFESVSRWFTELGLKDKMLAQRSLSFARAALRGGDFGESLRDLVRAVALDPFFAWNRGRIARLRADPLPSLAPYLS